jgi:hypothetical protein
MQGTETERLCPDCGASIPRGATGCPDCGNHRSPERATSGGGHPVAAEAGEIAGRLGRGVVNSMTTFGTSVREGFNNHKARKQAPSPNTEDQPLGEVAPTGSAPPSHGP